MINFAATTSPDHNQKFQPQVRDQKQLMNFINNLENENHPNLLNIHGDVVFLENINTVAFRTDSPDHISTWKQFCKTEMSLFHTLSIFR